jgi:hypothetical protein
VVAVSADSLAEIPSSDREASAVDTGSEAVPSG